MAKSAFDFRFIRAQGQGIDIEDPKKPTTYDVCKSVALNRIKDWESLKGKGFFSDEEIESRKKVWEDTLKELEENKDLYNNGGVL